MSDYDEILVSIRRIMRAVDLHSKKIYKTSGLTAPQLIVLQTLRKHGTLPPSTIAKEISLSQATVTSILDRLDKAGFTRRDRSTTDKRVVHACLTPTGLEKMAEAPELLQSGFLREFRKLEEWEQTQLVSSLQRIAMMMDAEDIDASPILDVGDLAE
ncbi:MarR family transcriptional regulator [Temperatibacter marinus]|uniref:MarR family transcriptional regulator n=1 Tax=Temperatibacter marinus TaxID=1456591 RepID=A0AA52H9W7_9PROT|nr:MarR family transcriptional regulator [Temperatibacter marinus]WND02018.1 MarR family transcriptional regulator [Temperatibacter marinus]